MVGAFVSSIPNENTDLLWEANSNRVHRLFVPYRNRDDRDDWLNKPEIIPYMEGALASGRSSTSSNSASEISSTSASACSPLSGHWATTSAR